MARVTYSGQGTGGTRATQINKGNNVSNATISTGSSGSSSSSNSSARSGGVNAVNANTAAAYNAAAQAQSAARQTPTNPAQVPSDLTQSGTHNHDFGITSRLPEKDPDNDPPVWHGSGSGSGGGRSGGGGSASPGSSYNVNTALNMPAAQDPEAAAAARKALSAELNPEWEKAQIDRVNYYDKQPMVDLMTQEIDAARAQYNNQIDRSMDTAANDLNRALTDAQDAFRTQQNQITAEELQARDNAALYAEARGDKGGIGQAQYNSIQNTAAQNRLQVRNAQTKLATDTARQISDLRAQGEFERADRMLELTQRYLSELRQIEEYAANYNLSVDQINTAIAEWEYNYNQAAQQFATNTELSLAKMTGAFSNGTPTYEAKRETDKALADLALNLIQAGVQPNQLTQAQLGALAEVYGMGQTGINQFYKVSN